MNWLIVCLGNPGTKYDLTRHNVGFAVGDQLVDCHQLDYVGKKFKSLLYKGEIGEIPVLLIKPLVYMNLSGEAVQLVHSFYQIPLNRVLVIYDDVDLPFGTFRYREKGGAGTHNGMRSILQCVGSQQFPRLRIGVGPIPEYVSDLSRFVLGRFTLEEQEQLPSIFLDVLPKVKDILYNQGHV